MNLFINNLLIIDCMNQSKINTFYLLGLGVFILRIAVPVVLLIFGIIDLIKVITSGSDKDMKPTIKRLEIKFVLAALVFLLPTFVSILLNITSGSSDKDGIEGMCVLNAISPECRDNVNFNYMTDPEVCYDGKTNSSEEPSLEVIEVSIESQQICNITWDYNGGVDKFGNKKLVGSSSCNKEIINTGIQIKKEGYTFENKWLVDCDWDCSIKGKIYEVNAQNPFIYTPKGNITLQAIWTKN